MTTGELITWALSNYLNAGSSTVTADVPQRKKAWFFATKVAKRLWDSAPYWFRLGDSTVALTAGVGTMPADFASFGTQGIVFVQDLQYRVLTYLSPDKVKALIRTTPQSGPPWCYSLYDETSTGVPKILCYPQDNSTLQLYGYVKKTPELIDAPMLPVLTEGAASTLLAGTYYGTVTFVTAVGETEAGASSLGTAVAISKNIAWSSIPTWWGRTVTARKLYRNPSTGTDRKLVATISNNTATTYTDAVADGALGAAEPLPAAAVTGLEAFPSQFHESALYDGLIALLSQSQGDGREMKFWADWDRSVRRMWEEVQQGQNTTRAFPAYPGFVSGHSVWSRFSPPQ